MNLEKTIKRIVILMAMAEEAKPIIDALALKPMKEAFDLALPFKCYQTDFKSSSSEGLSKGDDSDVIVTLVVSGVDPRFNVDNIGTQAATLMAQVAIQTFSPNLILSAGTAGGFAKLGATVGSVYLSDDEFVFHDRRVPIPGFSESSIGSYPALNVRGMAQVLQLPYGVISTGSSLQKNEQDLAVIEAHQAVAKEMEAAAIAWVCWLYQQPFTAIKSITNLLDMSEASEEQFLENLSLASRCLSEQLIRVIEFCANRTLASLGDG